MKVSKNIIPWLSVTFKHFEFNSFQNRRFWNKFLLLERFGNYECVIEYVFVYDILLRVPYTGYCSNGFSLKHFVTCSDFVMLKMIPLIKLEKIENTGIISPLFCILAQRV